MLLCLLSVHILQKKVSPRLFPWFLVSRRPPHNYFVARFDPVEDCPICYESLETPVKVEEDKLALHLATKLKSFMLRFRINVMMTPCGHRFHAVCLLNSMSHGLRCPLCKRALPPIF